MSSFPVAASSSCSSTQESSSLCPYAQRSSSSALIAKASLVAAKDHSYGESLRRIFEIRNSALGGMFDVCRGIYLFYCVVRVVEWIVSAVEKTSNTVRILNSQRRNPGFQAHEGIGHFLKSPSHPGAYKSVIYFKTWPFKAVIISHSAVAGAILQRHRNEDGENPLITLSTSFQALIDLLGSESLMTAPPSLYVKLREFANPFFGHTAVRKYVNVLLEESLKQITGWGHTEGEVVISGNLTDFSRNVLTKVFFGIDDVGSEIPTEIERLLPIVTKRLLGVPEFIHRSAYDQAQTLIAKKTEEILNQVEIGRQQGTNTSFLAEMVGAQTFSKEEVESMCKLLLFAGQDTTGNVLNALVYELGREPSWQARLYEDFQTYSSIEEFIAKSIVLTQCINEAERLYPSVFGINRRAAQDLVIELEEKLPSEQEWKTQHFFIPAGWDVFILNTYMNRDSLRWPDEPGEYKPSRDTSGNKNGKFIFGGAANPCLGRAFATLMMRTFIAQLVVSYRWETKNQGRVDFTNNLTIRLKEPIRISLEPR